MKVNESAPSERDTEKVCLRFKDCFQYSPSFNPSSRIKPEGGI